MLSDSEREETCAAFAPGPEHRVYGLGIRRRMAPMPGNDQQRIRLALALMMALPGTPIPMYGDEIGMGEDRSRPGRLAVCNPMQQSPGQADESHILVIATYRRMSGSALTTSTPRAVPATATVITVAYPSARIISSCSRRVRDSGPRR